MDNFVINIEIFPLFKQYLLRLIILSSIQYNIILYSIFTFVNIFFLYIIPILSSTLILI